METLVNQPDRTTYRCWAIILEIERFISEYGNSQFETRRKYYSNYYLQLMRLLESDQILLQRDLDGKLIGICGWLRVNKDDEWKINKTTWATPDDITTGDELYISFCILTTGSVWEIRRELKKRYASEIDEVFWTDVPHKRYVRIKNIMKDNNKEN